MTELGSELRRRREAAGYSLSRMATAVYSSKGHLSKVENGRTRVSRSLAAAYDHVLDANGELLALVDGQANPRRRRGLVGLPEHTRHFVGRAPELAAIASALGSRPGVRACVISGLGGVGKTALAVAAAWQAAADFRDGCLFFDLGGQGPHSQSTTETAHHLLGALDVRKDLIPDDHGGRLNLLRDVLRSRHVLLVLDNVRDAGQVRPLLPAEGPGRAIVTSRARLPGLDDAWHVPLDVLDTSLGQSLLRAVLDGSTEVEDSDAEGIAQQCGYLPLAIRIAATRILHGGWEPHELLRRLSSASTRFSALNEGDRGVAATLAVTIDALPANLRALLGALSLHPGPVMTTSAARALSGLDHATTDLLLDQLHEQHLATRTTDSRMRLHDLVQAYAFQYTHPDERITTSMIDRLVDHYLDVTIAADALLEPLRFRPPHRASEHSEPPFDDAEGALKWLRATWPALVRTTTLIDDDRCWQLALATRGFFFREKLFAAWTSTHQQALVTAAGNPHATGMLLNSLGMAYLESGRITESAEHHLRAHSSFVESGDEAGATDALASLAWARLYQGCAEDALRDLTIALESYRHAGRERNVVITLRGLAFALAKLKRHHEARAAAAEALDISSTPVDVMRALNCLAWAAYQEGDLSTARALSTQAAEMTENEYELARALTSLGNIAARAWDEAEAARLWSVADEHAVLNPAVVWETSARVQLS
ncbi:helix-turn-helix domain-containing protein [Lentzea sp. NPDC059081]|uniref:helix-turn-helix domain-containing protein n=1 Tax=Lentzea sp. NPDC059081 TaxID=3346719 RepID=UPI0036764450